MSSRYRDSLIFILFVVASLVFTYPLVKNIGSALRGPDVDSLGDPLLNTWALAWNDNHLSRLAFSGLFDANNFYPQKKTLLYSEHLMTQSLLALPVSLLTKNAILAYNIVFLAGLFLSGFGVYRLALYLTKNAAGSVAAGFIFAFCPFMTSHFYQIQVLSAWGIPFAFLYLQKFYDDGYRLKPLLLFTLFYVLQSWSNNYYALYLTFFAGAWIVYQAVLHKSWGRLQFWAGLALFAVLAAAATGPFFIQYAKVHQEMGFSRGMDFYARLTSYLVAPSMNRLYGSWSNRFIRAEGELFPGLIAVVLGVAALVVLASMRRIRGADVSGRGRKAGLILRRLVNWAILLMSLVAIWIMGQEGLSLKLFGQEVLSAHNLGRTLLELAGLILARVAIDAVFGFKRQSRRPEEPLIVGYAAVMLLAILFTFGPTGPYLYLYRYVPGFKSVRVASRFDIMVMFGLAVLAAFGLKAVIGRVKPALRAATVVLVIGLIAIEYISVPIPYFRIPTRGQIPEVYTWLAKNVKPGAIVELPFPPYDSGSASIEGARMYFSTFHWFPLVNGYSGYFPPLYTELCRRAELLPFAQLVDDFRALKVSYVLLHFDEIPKERWPAVNETITGLKDALRLIHESYGHYLFEVLPGRTRTPEAPTLTGLRRLPRDGWTAMASDLNDYAVFALDGSPDTRWDTGGPQRPGNMFELDLGKPTDFRCVSLRFGPSGLDFPRGYKMEVSPDGKAWAEVARQETTIHPILLFAKPRDLAINISVPRQRARYIRITNLGSDRKFYWSIYEIDVFD